MMSDPIADFLTRIRNAVAVNKKTVLVSHSKIKQAIAEILKQENYLTDYQVKGKSPQKELEVTIKYFQRNPTITSLTRISKPGVRLYTDVKDIPRLMRGRGIVILSSSQGIITGRQALKKNIGGEIICKVN